MNRRNKHIMFFGSLITLGSIPFIAAKCNDGNTKEESKNNETRPTDSSSDQNKNKNDDTNGQGQAKNDKDNLVNNNNNNNSSTNSNSETINRNSNPTPYHKKVKESHEEAASRLTKEYFDLLFGQKQPDMSDSMPSDEPGKSDDVMNDTEENSSEGKNKKPKDKLHLLFMSFNKYGNDIKKHLESTNTILTINNDLDPSYQIVKYEFGDIKSLLSSAGFESNFTDSLMYDLFEFYDTLSLLATPNYANNSDKQKASELFKKVKSKIDEAYKKAFNK